MTLPQYPFKLLSETCAAVDMALMTEHNNNGQRKRRRSRSVLAEIEAPLELMFTKEIDNLEKKFSFLKHHIDVNTQTQIDEILRKKSLTGRLNKLSAEERALKKKKKKLSNDATKILQVRKPPKRCQDG